MRQWQARTWAALLLSLAAPSALPSPVTDEWDGRHLMDEVQRRHEQYPYVFERQTMVLMDALGNRDVRKVRRFSRIDEGRDFKYLLVFDYPREVRGVALLARHRPESATESAFYLPAFGKSMKTSTIENRATHFLGTDFSVGDLTAEDPDQYIYARQGEQSIGDTRYHVLEARPRDMETERLTGYGRRLHFIRRDNLFIARTDYFDRRGRLIKRRTLRDLKRVDGDMWRANMVLMEDFRDDHRTLIKVGERIFSRDYVPAEIFNAEWLLANRHINNRERRLSDPVEKREAGPSSDTPAERPSETNDIATTQTIE